MKAWGPGLHPRHPCKKLAGGTFLFQCSGGGDRWVLETHRPASLAPVYKTQWTDLEEWHLRLTSDPHLLMPMHLHAYIQTCTHMHSKRGKRCLLVQDLRVRGVLELLTSELLLWRFLSCWGLTSDKLDRRYTSERHTQSGVFVFPEVISPAQWKQTLQNLSGKSQKLLVGNYGWWRIGEPGTGNACL